MCQSLATFSTPNANASQHGGFSFMDEGSRKLALEDLVVGDKAAHGRQQHQVYCWRTLNL